MWKIIFFASCLEIKNNERKHSDTIQKCGGLADVSEFLFVVTALNT